MRHILCIFLTTWPLLAQGILYPRDSETRNSKKLDGIWNFKVSPFRDQDVGFREEWYLQPLDESGETIPMPVPSSFNDVTQNKTLRDYLGWAWYDTQFFAPLAWKSSDQKVILRFGSAHYLAKVYLNGVFVLAHVGGHLPFETEVTQQLKFGSRNLLTVALNNTLSSSTIPQGGVTYYPDKTRYPEDFYTQKVNFDFFNYAGIHRSVILYTVPKSYIQDLVVFTKDLSQTTATLAYSVVYSSESGDAECGLELLSKDDRPVLTINGDCDGTFQVKNPRLWWPYTMDPQPAYMYTLKVSLKQGGGVVDTYYQSIGIRTIKVTDTSFLINGRPFYFRGFGKHEDANIRGKGLDFPLIVKDFNLVKWVGANSFRTSHYPYSEELMDMADQLGIVVIDETPAVALDSFGPVLLEQHKQVLQEMINRDKNRPSVVMWSLANEPRSEKNGSAKYFKTLARLARQLDPTRPVTVAINANCDREMAGQSLDVIMMNRYFAWYSDTGYPEVIQQQMVEDMTHCYDVYRKPIMISEYGADTVPGLHMDPPFVFTEDYQTEYMFQHHKAFDQLRNKGFFVGEHIWNFADFMTQQGLTRIVGNRKGIFTRERQPKAAAKVLRCRYLGLAEYPSQPIDDMYCPATAK